METEGKWDVRNGFLHLKSFDSFHDYKIKEIDSIGPDSLYLVFRESGGMGTNGSYIVLDIDTTRKYFVNQEGVIILSRKLSDFGSFDIHSGNGFDRYYKKNPKTNFFKITFSMDEDQCYIDDLFPLSRNKIFYPNYSMFFKKEK